MGLITPKKYSCTWKINKKTKRQQRGWWCVPEQSQKGQKDKMTGQKQREWWYSPEQSQSRGPLQGEYCLQALSHCQSQPDKKLWKLLMSWVDEVIKDNTKTKRAKTDLCEETSWVEMVTHLCMACRCFFGSKNRKRSQDFDSRWVKGNLKDSKQI